MQVNLTSVDHKRLFTSIDEVFFVNGDTHGDLKTLADRAGYNEDGHTLWVNSDKLVLLEVKGA